MSKEILIEILKQKDVYVTGTRLFVLGLIVHENGLLSLQKISELSAPRLNRITLYRTLKFFCEIGLFYRIYSHASEPYYALNSTLGPLPNQPFFTGNENYHFKCKICDKVICLPDTCGDIQLPPGFIKTEANLLFLGYCSDCSAKVDLTMSEKKAAYKIFNPHK